MSEARPPRIGALFAGYGGLDMAVEEVFGGKVAWYSEIDKGALKILDHRYPGVSNVGSVTEADWSQVEPIDILTGGSPCQDLSHAGARKGMTEGTRSNLWVAMREAIAQLRPGLVVWENVGGAFSAAADCEVEPCAGCVGDGSGVHLRALGRVLGDLSSLGYDASWYSLRAADVGAPHGRLRVFVLATDAQGNTGRVGDGDRSATSLTNRLGHERSGRARGGWAGSADGGLLPTPRATDGTKGGPNQRGSSGDLMLPSAVALLPTPAAQEPGGTLADYHARLKAHDGRDSSFAPLSMAVQLLPTPRVKNNEIRQSEGYGGEGGNFHGLLHNPERWGDYADAIARWERILGRSAPAPTMLSAKGNPQLAPAFVEWMMGLPAGWVNDVPGLTRNEKLKALGNGVVPQQAAAALREMFAWWAAA